MSDVELNYAREQLEAIGGLRSPLTGLYDTQPDEEWDRAWRTTEALLARMRERAAAMGAPLVIAAAPDWRALDPDAWRDELQRSNPRSNRITSGRLQIDAPNDQVGAMAERLGVPFVDLLPSFQTAVVEGVPLYFDFDKHWTAAGHAFAARAIDLALRNQKLTVTFDAHGGDEAAQDLALPLE